MYLEHVNLVVSDLNAMLHFYSAAFPHWHIRAQGQREWYGKARTWLHFGDDYHYIALSDHGEGANRELTGHTVGLAHFAYVTHNIAAVIGRLEAAGYNIAKNGAVELYRKNVYFIDPAGFEIEFVEYLSDLPEERNLNVESALRPISFSFKTATEFRP
jgi:catechol 2,3-dioxygenase-like lactoylglutathione lyase family enzyme